MADINMGEVMNAQQPIKVASGSFYLSCSGDQCSLTFVEEESNREEVVTQFSRRDLVRLATSSGSVPDFSDVTVHMHGESKCDISEPTAAACCDSEHECHICMPVERYLCFDWHA